MNSPMVRWARDGICIPELRLQQLSSRGVETARVRLRSRIVAAEHAGSRAGHRAGLAGLGDHILWSEEGELGSAQGELGDGTQRRHGGRHAVSERGVPDTSQQR